MEQQNHTQQYSKMKQHQKHTQAKCYNKSARDLPSLKTGDAVHSQLIPNMRKWVSGTIIGITDTWSYKVRTLMGRGYVRNQKFIKISHTDSRQSPKTTQRNIGSNEDNTHTDRPKRVSRKPQRLIESMNSIQTTNTQRFV